MRYWYIGSLRYLLYLTPFFVTDPPLGLFPFCRVPTASRQADRPSKPGMLSTGMGQYRARPIVPDHLAALKAKAPSPRAHGQSGLTSADARPEWRGHPSRSQRSS